MRIHLRLVLGEFPSARVVVTGYYPIVSSQSNIEFLIPLLAQLGLLVGLVTGVAGAVIGLGPFGFGPIGAVIFKTWLQSKLSGRSSIFATTANAALLSAVSATASAVPSRRLAFALPQFGPQNAIFAPDAFLYGVTASMGAEDPVAAARATACPTGGGGGIGGALGAIPTRIASIGHPNAKGAQAYADAIAAALPSLGL